MTGDGASLIGSQDHAVPPVAARLEACVTSVEQAVDAVTAGADRLELCRDLHTGGLTPSVDVLAQIRSAVHVPVFVMVRPRAGSFRMTPLEVEEMMRQAADLVDKGGADGLVLGLLDPAGRVDGPAVLRFVEACGVPVTFHKAFDEAGEPVRALEDLVESGVERVLTAGGRGSAWEGRHVLRRLVDAASDRITVLAGGAVRGPHVLELIADTGIQEVHARSDAIPGLSEALRRGRG